MPSRSAMAAVWSAPSSTRSPAVSGSPTTSPAWPTGPGLTLLERTVNGQPGLVAQEDGVTVTVIAFDIAERRIKHIWAVRNPEKLRPWLTD